MATQKAVVLETPNTPMKLQDVQRPTPGPKQALVKPLYVAINPVEPFMQQTGYLTSGLPAILGSDFCGIVLETDSGCTNLKKGDTIYACGNLGMNDYSPFQESFLVDDASVFHKTNNLTVQQAASIGVGLMTSSLGILAGCNITLQEADQPVTERDEWVVVLGGSGTLGHYGIQIARAAGYKVAASCSSSNAAKVKASGANASFNNRASPEEQAKEVASITGGKFSGIWDSSTLAADAAYKILEQTSASQKYFAQPDSGKTYPEVSGVKVHEVYLGQLGHDTDIGKDVTATLARLIPILQGHVEKGTITPVETEEFSKTGLEAVDEAIKFYAEGKAKAKLLVRLNSE